MAIGKKFPLQYLRQKNSSILSFIINLYLSRLHTLHCKIFYFTDPDSCASYCFDTQGKLFFSFRYSCYNQFPAFFFCQFFLILQKRLLLHFYSFHFQIPYIQKFQELIQCGKHRINTIHSIFLDKPIFILQQYFFIDPLIICQKG